MMDGICDVDDAVTIHISANKVHGDHRIQGDEPFSKLAAKSLIDHDVGNGGDQVVLQVRSAVVQFSSPAICHW